MAGDLWLSASLAIGIRYMKNVDFAVEEILDGEDAKFWTRVSTERETMYELVLRGRRFILSLRKEDGPHHHHADHEGL